MKTFTQSGFHLFRLLALILLISTLTCVGPEDPVDGLVENLPAIVNTKSAFTFDLRANAYSFEEQYILIFPIDSTTQSITTTLVVDAYKSQAIDSTTIRITNNNDSTLAFYHLNKNIVLVEEDSTVIMTIPKRVYYIGNNFTGIIKLSLLKTE